MSPFCAPNVNGTAPCKGLLSMDAGNRNVAKRVG